MNLKSININKMQVPHWVLEGNAIPISFVGVPPIEGALICPRCASTNITLDDTVLKTVPDRVMPSGTLRIGFACHSCEKSTNARNHAQILNITTEDGKIYCKWEK